MWSFTAVLYLLLLFFFRSASEKRTTVGKYHAAVRPEPGALLPNVFHFALMERKMKDQESASTMLPQAINQRAAANTYVVICKNRINIAAVHSTMRRRRCKAKAADMRLRCAGML
jgi:hypothetical protein